MVGQAFAPHSRSKRPTDGDRDRAEKQAESEDERESDTRDEPASEEAHG